MGKRSPRPYQRRPKYRRLGHLRGADWEWVYDYEGGPRLGLIRGGAAAEPIPVGDEDEPDPEPTGAALERAA